MFRRIFLLCISVFFLVPMAYYFFLLINLSHSEIQLEHIQGQAISREKSLPFYEVMSPIPNQDDVSALPSLEYKKGPPDRYIEKITLLFSRSNKKDKERAIYYGRRTESNWWQSLGMQLAGYKEEAQESNFLAAAIEYSIKGNAPDVSGLKAPIIKLAMLKIAEAYLHDVNKVFIQDQAGVPAFLFILKNQDEQQKKAKAFFFRRNSQFRIDYLADKNFEIIQPEDFFSKSFLTANRQDALGFVARNLSEVHFASSEVKSISMKDTSWPLSLIAATLSVDPSSIDAYFHFAGLNGLLFKSKELQTNDTEIIDTLRNNVLAAGYYAQDIAPQSLKAAEIARLARTLTRNMD